MTNTAGHRSSRKANAEIPAARWLAYATAGAATAVACVPCAKADIHHVDVNQPMNGFGNNPGNYIVRQYQLEPGAYLNFLHATNSTGTGGFAGFYFGTNGALSAQFIGVAGTFGGNPYHYVGKLNFGANISLGNFLPNVVGKYNPLATGGGYPNSQWTSIGSGYIGFRFDLGNGVQYGWAQLNMTTGPRLNAYTIIDYAYADPGETLVAGQVPEPGSLGLLAFGAVGLLLWRQKRTNSENA